jgi:ParB-like chromosome segregation protein Spo0J
MDEQARQRPIDPPSVLKRAESIGRHGLLQPIGLLQLASRDAGQPHYKLLYGAHRLAATRRLHPDDPGAVIAAMVYPAGTPELELKMLELVENLERLDLFADQLDALTTIYAGYCKQAGLVQPARDKQAQTQAERKGARHDAIESSPTVTRKLSAELGITGETAANRIKRSIESAKAAGVTVPGKTIETTSGEDLVKAGEAAKLVAEQKRKAEEERRKAAKPTRKRKPKGKAKINGEGKSGKSDAPPKSVLVRYAKNAARACDDARTALDAAEMAELARSQGKLDDFHRKQI